MNTLPYLALHILNSAWYRILESTVDTDAMNAIEQLQYELLDSCEPLSVTDVVGLLGEIRTWQMKRELSVPFAGVA